MASAGTSKGPGERKKTPKAKSRHLSAGQGQFSLFGGDSEPTPRQKCYSSRNTIKDTEHFYQTIQPGMGTKLFIHNFMKQTSVCFDTETTGLNPLTAELVGIAFSWETGKGFYLPFPEDKEEAQKLIEQLRPFFENEDIEKIGQNLKVRYQSAGKVQCCSKRKTLRHHAGALPHQP